MKKSILWLVICLFVMGSGYYIYSLALFHPQTGGIVALDNQVTGTKMRKFIHNKLWRDKGPARMEAVGSVVHVTILDDEEYNKQLGLKLLEEAAEVHAAKDKQELMSEIGDVLEVLDCIIALHDLSRDEIAAEQKFKREERGSMLERKFVTMTESIPGSFLDLYCSKDPHKYELIVE